MAIKTILSRIFFLSVFLLVAQPHGLRAQLSKQALERYGVELVRKVPPIVCPVAEHPGTMRIPPPAAFLQPSAGRGEAARFEVEYVGFPDDAKRAFQRAVDIWASLITSTQPIRIKAVWEPIDRQGVLGSARPTSFIRPLAVFPRFPVAYPIALAEKILKTELNPGEADIEATFNSTRNDWYFGIDGNPPANRLDLVTIVLHEIGHGLGFFHTFEVGAQTANYGFSGTPMVFDTFVENAGGVLLTDTTAFRNPSSLLRTQLISNNVFFGSRHVTNLNRGERAKLHAPTAFSPGSSIGHLDNVFDNTINQLMVPAVAPGESAQDPGPVGFGVFAAMGWVLTNIEHEPQANTDRLDRPFTLRARIASDTAIDISKFKATLLYSTNQFQTTQTVEMQATATRGEFQAQIPAPNAERNYNYYIVAENDRGVQLFWPGSAPRISWAFSAVNDTEAPQIVHRAQRFIMESERRYEIVARVTDRLGVDSVFLEYRLNNGNTARVRMPRVNGDFYGLALNLTGPLAIAANDAINYRITAVDVASRRNRATSNNFSVKVEPIGAPREKYANNFDNPSDDFVGADFTVTTPTGFANPAIHSEHPYKDGSDAFSESNYIYQLKFPITVRAQDATMRFDEVVLVEPGEPGALFGQAEFWDYVIVEGSDDRGVTWTPLLDGYDSRDKQEWLSAWNRSSSNNNSTTQGTPNLYRPRVIDMLRTFRAGQQVLLRFRLFADESVNGWGWAIDNLQIQPAVTGLDEFLVSKEDVKVFPNPTEGAVLVAAQFKKKVDRLRLSVTDLLGRQVYADDATQSGTSLTRQLELKGLAPGMYLINLHLNDQVLAKKIVLR